MRPGVVSDLAPILAATSYESTIDAFRGAAPTYDSVIPFFTTFGRRLVDTAALQSGERVLDVASGRGAALFPAAAGVTGTGSVEGVDIAPEMVQLLSADIDARGLTNASVRVGDAHDLDFDDAAFDVVLGAFCIFLLADPARAASEFHRVLRPGGRCAVSVFADAGPGWDFFGALARQFAPRAVGPMPPAPDPAFDGAAVLAGAGFVDLQVHDDEAVFRFAGPEAWWSWAWTQGMRGFLTALPDDALLDFKDAAFERLAALQQPDGLHYSQGVRYIVGRRQK